MTFRMSTDIAIVLTGTIKPTTKYAKYRNWKKRREEYICALNFYSKFGKIFFLENSEYDIFNDKEFQNISNVVYRKFDKDLDDEHAIGYQEFKMLDDWIVHEKELPDRWIKLSGRYIMENFGQILQQINRSDKPLIMDLNIEKKWADTYLFYIRSDFYFKHFFGKYKYVTPYLDIEEILYRYLVYQKVLNEINIFRYEPIFSVVTSGLGKQKRKKGVIKRFILNQLRKVNLKIYPYRIIYFCPFLSTYKRIIKGIKKIIN